MDFKKQYIIQSISTAANNLRLDTQKIEVVGLIRETIIKSKDLELEIRTMKTITELSTFAIRLDEIFNYLSRNTIDILKISEKFKEHSQFLITDLSRLLNSINPTLYKELLTKIESNNNKKNGNGYADLDSTNINLIVNNYEKSESEIIKEKIILDDDIINPINLFQNFEEEILSPVKSVELLLKNLLKDQFDAEELLKFCELFETNSKLAKEKGFEIISNMHNILAKALLLIRSKELITTNEIVEAMRSCLIVIVAVIKNKDVDITNYLNRAESFGRQIQTIKIEG